MTGGNSLALIQFQPGRLAFEAWAFLVAKVWAQLQRDDLFGSKGLNKVIG